MKSIEKVKKQRRIANIPHQMFSLRGRGLMRQGLAVTPDRTKRRIANGIKNRSRQINRVKH